MRMGQNELSIKEASLKALSKNKLENLDDEEALFIRKLEKGTGKYKGNLPLKFFNCGTIGHFSNKCPYQEKMRVIMKNLVVISVRPWIRRSLRKRRKNSIPKKIVTMKVNMHKS